MEKLDVLNFTPLYILRIFLILNAAYHELRMMSDTPSSSQIKRLTVSMNSQYDFQSCPNGVIGVQQSIKAKIMQCLTHFVQKATKEGISVPINIMIKLMGDGTSKARGLNIINVAFIKTNFMLGNYTVVLKASETYDELALGLQDICEEAELTIQGDVYTINIFKPGACLVS